jgi:ketosteroid isomerase-like protein
MATTPEEAAVETPAAAVVREVYRALAAGDRDALLGCLRDDFEWVEPGDDGGPLAGSYSAHDGVTRLLDAVPVEWRGLRCEPQRLVEEGSTIIVLGSISGAIDGRAVDVPFAHAWELDGELAASGRSYLDARVLDGQPERRQLSELADQLATQAASLRAGWADLDRERDRARGPSAIVDPAQQPYADKAPTRPGLLRRRRRRR